MQDIRHKKKSKYNYRLPSDDKIKRLLMAKVTRAVVGLQEA